MAWTDFLHRKPKKIGLSLSGGAIHGAAHIGVIQVLEREGIKAHIVTGTSAGAIIGAAYAAGVSTQDMDRLFREARWPSLVKLSWKNTLSLFDTQPLEDFIRTNICDLTFEELPCKFATIACDILTGERVVLNSGPMAPAVRASAAYPGLFSPIEMNGKLLVDGGAVDNLPSDLAREMGADYVIGVDLSTPTRLTHAPENPFEVLMAFVNVMQARAALPEPELNNCLIKPEVEEFSAWDLSIVDELEARGRAAAEKAIIKIKEDLGKK
ncbi:MAG TPA: patatin-like phospholipase family protein [Longilinea sp.]|nr:patatin-like phospholipase family protein [Longilinea sp.]